MIRNRNIANASWIIGCRIVQSILGVVISMLTARYLGPSHFGVINYAAAIVAFVAPIAKLGLTHVLVQEIVYSPESEGKILGTSLIMSLVSSVFCIIGVIAFSVVTNPNDTETILVCALYSLLLISNALEVIQFWYQANLISKYTSIVSVIAYLVISVYKSVLLITEQSVYWFALSNAIDHFLIGIVLLIIYKKKNGRKLGFSFDWVKRLFSQSKFFIISSMMITIFAQTDKIMLKFMLGDEATGIYSAAIGCASMTSFVFSAIAASLRPTILEHKKASSPLYETNMCRLYTITIYMALAQSVAMTLLAKPIILIMYGQEFIEAVPVLQIGVWFTTFSYIGSARDIWMLAENKQQHLLVINLSGALTNVLLNMLLIPFWGTAGAAIASVATQIFANSILGFIYRPIRPNNWLVIKSLDPKSLIGTVKLILKRK